MHGDDVPERVVSGDASGSPPPLPVVEADPPAAPQKAEAGRTAVIRDDAAAQWETVERLCPWPPEPSAWSVLDGPCLEAMDAIEMTAEWRAVMDDPAGTQWAVAAALDDVQCHVPDGKSRPDLREACAADAMVRLAKLQRKCMEYAHMDWGKFTRSVDERMRTSIRLDIGPEGEWLFGFEEREDSYRTARQLWEVHRCRSALDALEWLKALPRPPGNLVNAGLEVYDPEFIHADDDGEQQEVSLNTPLPRLTQDVELLGLARRLGAKLPDWADRMLDAPRPVPAMKRDGD